MTTEKLTGQQIADAGLDGWVNLLGGLQTRIRTSDFATGLRVVNAIGAAADLRSKTAVYRLVEVILAGLKPS